MKKTKIGQSFNNRLDAWVKVERMANGKTKIINVKQREPQKKFKGVSVFK